MRYITAAIAAAALSLTSFTAIAQETDSTEATEETTAEAAPEYKDVDASTVIATVNGVDITLGHVILLRTELPEQYLTAPDDILFEAIVDQLIEQELLSGTITEDPREITLTIENETRALRAGAAIQTALLDAPAEEEYQAAYDAAMADFPEEPEFNASHILVETEEEASAIVTELEEGADFADLAKQKSTGPSGPDGGALGWFGLGQMVSEFETAVTALEPGQVSAPVQTQFGWHVILLNETRMVAPPTLDEVRDQITQQLQRERIDATINAIREDSTVETFTTDVDPAAIKDLTLITE